MLFTRAFLKTMGSCVVPCFVIGALVSLSARLASDFSIEGASWPVKNGCVGFSGAVDGSIGAFELIFWMFGGPDRIALILSPRSLRVFFRLPYLIMTISLFTSSSLSLDRRGLPRRGPALDVWTLGDANFPSDRTFSIFLGGVRAAAFFDADEGAIRTD